MCCSPYYWFGVIARILVVVVRRKIQYHKTNTHAESHTHKERRERKHTHTRSHRLNTDANGTNGGAHGARLGKIENGVDRTSGGLEKCPLNIIEQFAVCNRVAVTASDMNNETKQK